MLPVRTREEWLPKLFHRLAQPLFSKSSWEAVSFQRARLPLHLLGELQPGLCFVFCRLGCLHLHFVQKVISEHRWHRIAALESRQEPLQGLHTAMSSCCQDDIISQGPRMLEHSKWATGYSSGLNFTVIWFPQDFGFIWILALLFSFLFLPFGMGMYSMLIFCVFETHKFLVARDHN